MGQAVKYAVLGVALSVAIIAGVAAINSLYFSETLNNFGTAIMNFISSASAVINSVRGALNYICGSPLPFTILLHVALVLPFSRFVIWVTSSVIHFINQ